MTISWGTITWYLFHTLAEKIKEESFDTKKTELIKLIILICNNLPCPECQDHAKEMLRHMKIREIKSKEDFQKMLWSFHNIVNKRRRVHQFTFEECKNKFSKGNLNVILSNFTTIWSKNYNIMKLMGSSFNRSKCVDHVKKWMNQNAHHFDE